ncbi:MAG: CAP domain-containing protein [Defluviitaleaceae bacterium]|nr:CAP domain-containing protein [Defluviitaleaceae bacterium]
MNLILFFAMLMNFSFSGLETDLIHEINKEREAIGVSSLAINWEVSRLARYRSEEMVELSFFGHSSRIYGEPDEMLMHFGVPFNSAGVNIAKGQETAREVLDAWLSSSAHSENLLNANFTSAGVGIAYNDGLPYWTLFLISSA